MLVLLAQGVSSMLSLSDVVGIHWKSDCADQQYHKYYKKLFTNKCIGAMQILQKSLYKVNSLACSLCKKETQHWQQHYKENPLVDLNL